ncbi:MAG: hypothetical protein ACRDYF_14615 [Acidimicrobiia bacterium]
MRAAETAVLTGDYEQARDLVRELLTLLAEMGSRRWVADTIELAALILEHGEQGQAASRLMGACAAIRLSLGEPAGGLRALAGTIHGCHERLSGKLSGEQIAEQEARGGRFSVQEAIAYALEWLEPAERIPG